ncbi:MAG: serine hydrolase domain-containing protein [Gemmatimonadales bacterium]
MMGAGAVGRAAVLGTLVCGVAVGQVATEIAVATPGVGQRMAALVTQRAALGFSGQVVVAQGDSILLDGAFGFADRASRRPMRRDTPLGVASVSKQILGVALLALVDRGALRLQDRLGDHLDGVPAEKADITLEQILTHRAGLRGGHTDDFASPSREAVIAARLADPLVGAPGEAWAYSSDGYNLLAAVVERAAGMPYAAWLEQAVFEPAGMRHSAAWSGMPVRQAEVATAYQGIRATGAPQSWPLNWRVFGGGDVFSTAADLAAFDRALRNGDLLGPATRGIALRPLAPINDEESYGAGLFFLEDPELGPVIEHGGDTELGYNAVILRYPRRDLRLFITSNSTDAQGLSMRQWVQADLVALATGTAETSGVPAVRAGDPEDLRTSVGEWAVGSSARLRLVTDGAYLWAMAEGQDAVALFAAAAAPDTAARALASTERLLRGLSDRIPGAYATALTPEGAEWVPAFEEEWDDLRTRFGLLHRFELLGAVRDGEHLTVTARLGFRTTSLPMSFRWSDGGVRLRATQPWAPPAPILLPVGFDPGGRLVILARGGDRIAASLERTGTGDLLFAVPGAAARRLEPRPPRGS